MADVGLTPGVSKRTGVLLVKTPIDVADDYFIDNAGNFLIVVDKGIGGALTIAAEYARDFDGQTIPPKGGVLPLVASGDTPPYIIKEFGPFPPPHFNNNVGRVKISFSGDAANATFHIVAL